MKNDELKLACEVLEWKQTEGKKMEVVSNKVRMYTLLEYFFFSQLFTSTSYICTQTSLLSASYI